jgi:hypothetical protein
MMRLSPPVAQIVRRRAVCLVLAALAMFVASVLPACGTACCAAEAEASMHATMPCCETPSVRPSDSTTQAVKQPVSVQIAAAPLVVDRVAVVMQPAPPSRRETEDTLPDTAPPLFLLNAQFLI